MKGRSTRMYKQLLDFHIFEGISEQSKERIMKIPILYKEYEAEEIVSFFGEELKYIHFILKGTLKTTEYSIQGREIVSSYYPKRSIFPFYLLYSGAQTQPYNITCFKDAQVIHVPAT